MPDPRQRLARSIVPLVALTLLLAPGLATPAVAGAAGAPAGPDAIVFAQSSNQGAWEIWAIRPGDPAPRPILQRDGITFQDPAWSPDGTRIAFRKQVSNRVWRVMVMRADGTDVRVVSSRSPLGDVNWSPDGARLAFASQVDGIAQIFTVGVSGANLEQVTHELTPSTEPIWSHDGTRLYHQSQELLGPQNRLYVIDTDGSDREALTDDTIEGHALSPDGSQLAVGIRVDGVVQVHLMPADGGTPAQVTNGEHDAFPSSWSPDGERILILHWIRVDSGALTSIAPDGSDPQVILDFVDRTGDWGTPAFVDTIGHSLVEHIAWAVDNDITAGCDIAEFCPDRAVTREQLAAMFSRALDLPDATDDYFDDDNGTDHEDDINRLAEAGIAGGCAPDRFCPFSVVTRAQAAAMIDRALELPTTTVDAFDDDDGMTHEASINRAAAAGIVSGCGPDRFCPTRGVTRAQLVTMLHRALD